MAAQNETAAKVRMLFRFVNSHPTHHEYIYKHEKKFPMVNIIG